MMVAPNNYMSESQGFGAHVATAIGSRVASYSAYLYYTANRNYVLFFL